MSAPLSAEERTEYTRVIDKILHASDLETVTRKAILRGLEEAVNKKLVDQKEAIKKLITARFDAISAETVPSPPSPAPRTKQETNGHKHSEEQSAAGASASPDSDVNGDAEIHAAAQPAKKKQKRESSTDADARLAAELQAQEEALARGRTTRGAGTSKATKKGKTKTKTPKKKSAKRARDDSDSELSGAEDGEKPKRKVGGGFQKPFTLSYPLVELCGEEQLSRPQVVKKLWEHIKGNNLQNPENKRQILCDAKMEAIFKVDKVDMFQMNKLIGNHLYPIEAE